MDREQLFADLDRVRWRDLDHAYGEADDLPALLRALAADDERAQEALEELWSTILHQGTVYAATAETVPFLARLASTGTLPAELLALLGGIAESRDEHGTPHPGSCRAAVARQLPLILPLFGSDDPEVRASAVWAAGRTGSVAALPELRRHWRSREELPSVRAELLAAIAAVDPAGGAAAALAALTPDTPAELRVVAVLTSLDLGLAWTPAHREAMVSLLPAGPHVAGRIDADHGEPLHYAVDALLRRDTDADRTGAYELIEAALRLPDPGARAEALWAAEHACMISRGAPARLAPALLALIGDPSSTVTAAALPVLGKLGGHAAPAAPLLAALAAPAGDLADRALEALLRIAPEQAGPLLARDLDGRPRTMRAVTGRPGRLPALGIPYATELLNAIRIRLTRIAGADDPAAGDPDGLAGLLRSWGPRAAAALPELSALCERFPTGTAEALAAVCPPEHREETAALLRRAAAAESARAAGRRAAAEALRTLTGETGPLVSALQEALAESPDPGTARAAGELGPEGKTLVPELRRALTPRGRKRVAHQLNTDTQAALALWRLTGEAEEPVRVLGGVLAEAADGMWTRGELALAARAAGCLGAEATSLAPALEGLLDDPRQAPGALLALHSMGQPADPVRAAGLLLLSAELGVEWETALEALDTLGLVALTPEVTARLTALAERDPRVVVSGPEPEIIPGDERLRARARQLLAPS
ncbi:HEAT repeat domain-containing protein [Streptomyces sp. NPDC001985]|uniref:HEAT repeat domain-containing protein n=1 Tax=Streptomyces sp. NPDC001985 TaxID=3154406 RepID=UPI00332CDE22